MKLIQEDNSMVKLEMENGIRVATFTNPGNGVEGMRERFWQFQQNSELCDVCLVADLDDTCVLVHKLIPSVSSKYFDHLFRNVAATGTFGRPAIVRLEGITGTLLKQIVEFIYTGKIQILEHSVPELLRLGQLYQLENLTAICEKFLIHFLDSHNFLEYEKLATMYGCAALKEEVDSFVDK